MKSKEISRNTVSGDTIKVQSGSELTPNQIARSIELYKDFRDADDEACRIGLYGSDLETVLKSRDTIMFEYEVGGEKVHIPLLVPISNLEWYNDELLKRTYAIELTDQQKLLNKHFLGRIAEAYDTSDEETFKHATAIYNEIKYPEIYYYTHPPLPEDEVCIDAIIKALRELIDKKAVIIFDKYADRDFSTILQGLTTDGSCKTERIGGEEFKKIAPVFIGKVEFNGVNEVKEAPSLYEVYEEALESGAIMIDGENDVSMMNVFTDEEAQKIWDIVYEQQFEELGVEDPIYAGFDKDTLIGILKNPDIAKIVSKENGEFSALCFFDNNFDNCPWFNKEYYRDNYPEYYETNNIFLFPGIVAAKSASSKTNAISMINFAVKIFSLRKTNAMLTFECTQISAQYIPVLAWFGINHSGLARIEDSVKDPISTMEYYAVKEAA